MKRLLILLALTTSLAACGSPAAATPAAVGVTAANTQPPPSVGATEAVLSPTQPALPATEAVLSRPCEPTPADQEGPYYKAGAPFTDRMAPADLPGDRLILTGVVVDTDCKTPLAGAVIDLWQADSKGNYDFSDSYILRGKVKTDDQGHYRMETIVPGYYEPRPRHIHIKVSFSGRPTLTSQIYFTGDPRAAGLPAALLIDPVEKDGVLTAEFDIVLGNS